MDLKDPKKVYDSVNQQLSKFDQFNNTEVENELFQSTKETVLDTINREKEDLILKINELEEKSEWNVFSIAFYGETNAGKSTLIETLRILLNEPNKQKDRIRFNEFSKDIDKANESIKEKDADHATAKQQFDADVADVKSKIDFNQLEIDTLKETLEDFDAEIELNEAIIARKASESLKALILSIFKKLPENALISEANKEKKKAQQAITTLVSDIKDDKKLFKQKEKEYKESVQSLEEELTDLKNQVETLEREAEPFSDGKIIGTGESDYTREVGEYQFELNGQKFKILDLPGIEGKESVVQDEIMNALKRVHAVFYMSGKPTPPQSGDSRQEGTIEKIKNQLADQSEIYFVYNKRVQSPRGLNSQLISDEEEQTLVETDNLLSEKLGTYYEGHKVLSALPGFLSVANLTNADRNYKNQQKFKEKMAEEDILEFSRVEDFSNFLRSNLINNVQSKIKVANYNKVQVTLSQLRNELSNAQQKMMVSKNQMDQLEESSDNQIDSLVMELKSRLDQAAHKVVNTFEHKLRKSVYASIDNDLSNGEFKSMMERKITESEEEVKSDITSRLNDEIEQFNQEAQDVVSKFQKYSTNIAGTFDGGDMLDLTSAFTFDPKSKQSPLSVLQDLGSGIGGIAALAFFGSNPVGWALAIVGLGFSLFRTVRGFFDSDYKKSQQKNAADSKISDLSDEIRKNLQDKLDEVNNNVEDAMEEIKGSLAAVVNQISLMNMTFDDVVNRIVILENELKSEVNK